jgi:hypothetical protein
MRPGATSLNSNMIRDGHPACRLKPASPAVPAASAKEENKNNNDEKCLGIHDVQPFQCDGFGLGTLSGEMPSSLPAPAARRHVRDVVFVCPAGRMLRCLEQAHRPTRTYHINRNTNLGTTGQTLTPLV